MIAFLASHIGGSYKLDGKRYPTYLNSDNGLVEKLKARWTDNCPVLIISADPDSIERNDSIRDCLAVAFPMSGLPISEMTICDRRNEAVINDLPKYPVIILSGGHVPTQNAYFERLKLKERLESFDGIIIGISAGTMNSAEIVYAQPEVDGEAVDSEYRRFLPGLGLTKVMVLPHYQAIKDDILDGMRLFEDITYPDSHGREFYALVDGSFLIVENGVTTLYGEVHRIKDGAIEKISGLNERVTI